MYSTIPMTFGFLLLSSNVVFLIVGVWVFKLYSFNLWLLREHCSASLSTSLRM